MLTWPPKPRGSDGSACLVTGFLATGGAWEVAKRSLSPPDGGEVANKLSLEKGTKNGVEEGG